MIKISIIDDNRFYIDNIKELLKKHLKNTDYHVYEFLTASEFLTAVDSERFDIVFLDIVLGTENGIEIGRILNEKQPNANVIFISANSEYFKDVYHVNHSYFLIKEFEEERFSDALSKVLKNINKSIITIDTKNGKCKIVLNDILYCESSLRHTRLHMKNGETLEYSINLKNFEDLLPEKDFVRTHQSFIVNMKHIKKYDSRLIHMDYRKSVPISRTHSASAREKITCYLGGIL